MSEWEWVSVRATLSSPLSVKSDKGKRALTILKWNGRIIYELPTGKWDLTVLVPQNSEQHEQQAIKFELANVQVNDILTLGYADGHIIERENS